jgi:hypothetical protein
MRSLYPSADALDVARAAAAGETTGEPPPGPVLDWLARLRLLCGVPFAYLVPDARLLPEESIRFFYLDRNWTDAAIDGALATGAGTTRERAHLQARHATIRDAVDGAERNLWSRAVHDTTYAPADAEVVTGFLLRSRAVSGWPGLHVSAKRPGSLVRLLRVERLSPAVLLVLFDGVPDRVVVEEPRSGIQFGFDPGAGTTRTVTVRDANWQPTGPTVPVPMRPGGNGTVDVAGLRTALNAARSGSAATVADFARQLVQFPFRQPFEGTPDATAFQPSVTMDDLDSAFGDTP